MGLGVHRLGTLRNGRRLTYPPDHQTGPPHLLDAMSLLILPRPNIGQQSPTTTGPLREPHLTRTSVSPSRRTKIGTEILKGYNSTGSKILSCPLDDFWFLGKQHNLVLRGQFEQ